MNRRGLLASLFAAGLTPLAAEDAPELLGRRIRPMSDWLGGNGSILLMPGDKVHVSGAGTFVCQRIGYYRFNAALGRMVTAGAAIEGI